MKNIAERKLTSSYLHHITFSINRTTPARTQLSVHGKKKTALHSMAPYRGPVDKVTHVTLMHGNVFHIHKTDTATGARSSLK